METKMTFTAYSTQFQPASDSLIQEITSSDVDSILFDVEASLAEAVPTNLDPLAAALEGRGIDIAALSPDQRVELSTSEELISTLLSSQPGTTAELNALIGDGIDLQFVEDFRTTSGQKLNGAATEDGKVILDAGLSGADLVHVIIEEIAEATYYSVVGAASQGDFGAEVAYRANGGADVETIATFQSDLETDTVETDFGTAQASSLPYEVMGSTSQKALFQVSVDDALEQYQGIDQFDFDYMFIAEYGGTVQSGTWGSELGQRYENASVSDLNGKFDLNGDGLADEYNITGAWAWSYDGPDVESAVITDVTALPGQTDLASGGNKTLTESFSYTKGQTFTTTDTYAVNASVSATLSTKGGIPGLGAVEASVTGTVGFTGSTAYSNTISATTSKTSTITVDSNQYDRGELFQYGNFLASGTVEASEEVTLFLEIANAKDGYGDTIHLVGDAHTTIDDYAFAIVKDDFSVTEGSDLIGLELV